MKSSVLLEFKMYFLLQTYSFALKFGFHNIVHHIRKYSRQVRQKKIEVSLCLNEYLVIEDVELL